MSPALSPSRVPYLFPKGAQLGADNVILHARSRRHHVEGYAGPLSVKTVRNGRVAWIVSGRELVVDRSSFLILGPGERYSMHIDADRPVETCCAFFSQGYVERVALDVTSRVELSLDEPDRAAPALPYLSALHGDRERNLVGEVQTLARRCRWAIAPIGSDEGFLRLAEKLLSLYRQIRQQAMRVPAMRASTKQELFGRLLRGREYMHAQLSGPISLASVARAAGVSQFHFHRGFRLAFQKTPHEYVTALRLERAHDRIAAGARVIEACLEVGFSSPSAFSRLFRSRYGEPPSALQHRR